MEQVKGYDIGKDPRLINCKTECGNTACLARKYGLFAEKTCPNYIPPQMQTNADRIRAMTDEELAKWIWTSVAWQISNYRHDKQVQTDDEWLDWLRQEASDVN